MISKMHSVSLCNVWVISVGEVSVVVIHTFEEARVLAEREVRASQVLFQYLVLFFNMGLFLAKFLLSN